MSGYNVVGLAVRSVGDPKDWRGRSVKSVESALVSMVIVGLKLLVSMTVAGQAACRMLKIETNILTPLVGRETCRW